MPESKVPELRQRRADVAEYCVDRACDAIDPSDARQCDQANQQCILNQVLTFLAVLQVLEFHEQFQKYVAHFSSPIR
jgi:hypothetical protein